MGLVSLELSGGEGLIQLLWSTDDLTCKSNRVILAKFYRRAIILKNVPLYIQIPDCLSSHDRNKTLLWPFHWIHVHLDRYHPS